MDTFFGFLVTGSALILHVVFRLCFNNCAVNRLQIIPLSIIFLFVFPFSFLSFLNLYTSSIGLLIFFCFYLASQLAILAAANKHSLIILLQLPRNKKLANFVYFTSTIYLLAIFQNVSSSAPLDILLNVSSVSNSMSKARYSGELQVSLLYKLSIIFNFASAVVAGALLLSRQRKPVIIFILVALLDSILMGARAGFLMIIFSIFVSQKVLEVKFNVLKFRTKTYNIIYPIVLLLILVLYFFGIQVLRGGGKTDNLLGIFNHILTWFFGYIPAFSIWIEKIYSSSSHTLGLYTFYGPATWMGFAERQGGVFLPVEIGQGRISNVFTVFRGLIMDFSLPGAVVMWFSLIGLASYLSHPTKKNTSFLYIGLVMIIFSFLSWSFVISIWSYNSVIIGQILGIITLKMFLRDPK